MTVAAVITGDAEEKHKAIRNMCIIYIYKIEILDRLHSQLLNKSKQYCRRFKISQELDTISTPLSSLTNQRVQARVTWYACHVTRAAANHKAVGAHVSQ